MNQRVRKAVKDAIRRKGLTQKDVATALGIDRVYVNRMLSGNTSQVPQRWAQPLDLLSLELTVQPKDEEPKAS